MWKKSLYVYLNIEKKDYFVGTLDICKDDRIFSMFEYSDEWLNNKYAYQISKELPLRKGVFKSGKFITFHTFICQSMIYPIDFYFEYLLLYLSKNNLLDITEKIDINELYEWFLTSNNCCCKFFASDEYPVSLDKCIMYQNDKVRNGSFRFKYDKNGDFTENLSEINLPKLDDLEKVIKLIDRVSHNQECSDDLKILHAYCSGLNGRKSKCNVIDNEGNLCIAKLPSDSKDDEFSAKLDSLGLILAKNFGLNLQEYFVNKTSDDKDYIFIKRFDRKGDERIPFIAMQSFVIDRNFRNDKLISSTIIKLCKKDTTKNLHDFFKRKLFRIAIVNTKAFLPNVGFLFNAKSNSWNLAPDYDITVGYRKIWSLGKHGVREDRKDDFNYVLEEANLLVKNCHYYRLNHKQVKKIVKDLKFALKDWYEIALKVGIPQNKMYRVRIFLEAFDKIKYKQK